MRVVAGRFKGRRLAGPKDASTRPTADKVREALFSALGSIDDERVLDLFAGTGALGIEALSRGAGSAEFVEKSRTAARVVQANLETVGASKDEAHVQTIDAVKFLESAAARGEQYDLVFVDPPYAAADALAPRLSMLIPRVLADGGRVVVESDRRRPLEWVNDPQEGVQNELTPRFQRIYGDTLLRVFTAHD